MTAPDTEQPFLIIDYQLNRDDLTAMLVDRETHRFPRFKKWGFNGMMVFFCICLAFGVYVSVMNLEAGLMLVCVSVASLVLMPVVRKWQPKWVAQIYFKRLGLEGQDLTTSFSKHSISSQSANTSAVFEWSSIKKITRSNSHFFFWVNKIQAIIVPLRAVADKKQAEELWSVAEKNMENI